MHISKDSGVSLVLRIVNNLPLVENADSDSAAPLILHNADELYDSSTSCWNPSRRNESNTCIELLSDLGHNAHVEVFPNFGGSIG
ncbi:hypothetical protein Tco_1162099, partial [Tanacetum coccineum]